VRAVELNCLFICVLTREPNGQLQRQNNYMKTSRTKHKSGLGQE